MSTMNADRIRENGDLPGATLSVDDLVSASRAYLAKQQAAGAVLSPTVTPTSPGPTLARALAGAAKIQRS